MQKKNLRDETIDLVFFIKLILKEKILVLLFCTICSLVAYLFISFSEKNFITEIKLKGPPLQLFELYNHALNSNNKNDNINGANIIAKQFIDNFESKFLSSDYLESFIEQSRDFDFFKKNLESRNTTPKQYYADFKFRNVKENDVKENDVIVQKKYFLVLPKKIDEIKFISNYLQFIKNISVIEFKKNLKLSIENQINIHEQNLEIAKVIKLEDPIIKSTINFNLMNEPDPMFYKGTKVLSQKIFYLKKILLTLEKDQFNYDFMLEIKSRPSSEILQNHLAVTFFGFLFGLFLSIVIISIRAGLKVGIKL